MAKAPALRLVIETVTGWSEYWKCNWTSSTRSHCRQQIPMASPDQSHTCKSTSKKLSSFSTATYQHRYQKTLLQRSHKISHRLCVSSVGWLWRGTLKKLNFLHRRAGKLILPDPSLSTEQKTSALWILNLPQQLAYNKGIFMHKVLNNNFPNYLAQLFISHQSHYTNSRNNLYVPRPRLNLFETSISFDGAFLWNSLSQNIKSCISLPCFKRNLHKYMSENNLSSSLDGFVWITRLPKQIECCIHVCPWKKFNSDVSAHS